MTPLLVFLAFLGGVLAGVLTALSLTLSRCRHDRLRTIYGDEIHAAGGHRSACLDCGATFPQPAEPREHP